MSEALESTPEAGTSFEGRYRLEGKIGQGGMGTVYRAKRLADGLPVAVKIVTPASFGAEADSIRRRFELEARATAMVRHPNTVAALESGRTTDGRVFLVMELLTGWRLSDLVEPGNPMGAGRAVDIASQLADALSALHKRGLVHRDLKAENVLIVPRPDHRDHVKLIDFGVARDLEGDHRLTSFEHRVGTPTSMAPEYLAPESRLDARADLYALGVVMFHMLTGSPPYAGTPEQVMSAHRNVEVPRPSARVPRVPSWLDEVVHKLLQKDPDARYQTAAEVRTALAASPGRGRWNVVVAIVLLLVLTGSSVALALGG